MSKPRLTKNFNLCRVSKSKLTLEVRICPIKCSNLNNMQLNKMKKKFISEIVALEDLLGNHNKTRFAGH